MRSLTSIVAGLVAVVVALVTVPLLWISTHVVDEDGFVTLSSQLATDDELQGAFVAYLVDDYVQRGVLPESLRTVATSALTAVTRGTTNRPGFVTAFEETLRSLHTSAFSGQDGPLTVNPGPMATFVSGRVGDRLPMSLTVPTDLSVTVGTPQDRERLGQVERSQTYALIGLMVVLAAAAVSLMSARSRPWALAGLGFGALATAGVLRVATEMVTPDLIDRAAGTNPFAQTLQKLLVARVSESLSGWLGWIAVAGAVAVVLGLLGRLFSGRQA